MGWLWQEKPPSVKEFLDGRITGPWGDQGGQTRVLRSAIVGLKEYYAATEITVPGKPPVVIATIYLLQFAKGEMGRKDMDETAGPYAHNCPEAILNLLTEIPDWLCGDTGREYAANWRKACRNVIAMRRAPREAEDWMVAFPAEIVATWKAKLQVEIGGHQGYLRSIPHAKQFWLVKTPAGKRGWPVTPGSRITATKMGKAWVPVVHTAPIDA